MNTISIESKDMKTYVYLNVGKERYLIPATEITFNHESFDEIPYADIRVLVSEGKFLLPTNINKDILEYIKGCKKLSNLKGKE